MEAYAWLYINTRIGNALISADADVSAKAAPGHVASRLETRRRCSEHAGPPRSSCTEPAASPVWNSTMPSRPSSPEARKPGNHAQRQLAERQQPLLPAGLAGSAAPRRDH